MRYHSHRTLVGDLGCYTPFTRYNRLWNRLYNRIDNRLYRVNKRPTGCQTGCQTDLTTSWMFVYTKQPVVKPVVKRVWQRVWQPVVSCKRGFRETRWLIARRRCLTTNQRPAYQLPTIIYTFIHHEGSTKQRKRNTQSSEKTETQDILSKQTTHIKPYHRNYCKLSKHQQHHLYRHHTLYLSLIHISEPTRPY